MIKKPMLIANDIYVEEHGLIGSQCQNCKERFFPQVNSCANCSSESIEPAELGHKGQLWSWTIQRYLPKTPYSSGETSETFTPYGVGLIQMPSGVIIKSRIGLSEEPLAIGQKMELHIVLFSEADGDIVHTYEFRQTGSQ